MHDHYLPVILSALTVVVLGCMNPQIFQKRTADGQPDGSPNYVWLSVVSLVVGLLACYVTRGKEMAEDSECYLPVIITSLTILVLGCWNPTVLQRKEDSHPNYMWLALVGLLLGLGSSYFKLDRS